MKRAFLVAGLGWGDESKGATTDFLTWKYGAGLVVRYSGGSQCGHNVVTPDGRHHTFQQFGAGMFHPGIRTHLSRFMLINPMNMMREEEHLREVGITDAWERTSVDPRALIITPFHRELNRAMTPAGTTSCGHGVGVCREMHLAYGDRVLFAGDLLDKEKTITKLQWTQLKCLEKFAIESRAWPIPEALKDLQMSELCWDWYKDWRELVQIRHLTGMLDHETIIFEGAQGVLLDETHGDEGFNTWTDTTFNNANTLLDEAGFDGQRTRVGVIRTYYTRHGAGPFPTEDPALNYPEPHNEDSGYQGKFRRGKFDDALFHKALDICGGIDWLAVNHIDRFDLSPEGYYKWHNIFGYGPTCKDRQESWR
jgi:adenylosuccinate synthase